MGEKMIAYCEEEGGYFNIELEEDGRISKWKPIQVMKKGEGLYVIREVEE